MGDDIRVGSAVRTHGGRIGIVEVVYRVAGEVTGYEVNVDGKVRTYGPRDVTRNDLRKQEDQ